MALMHSVTACDAVHGLSNEMKVGSHTGRMGLPVSSSWCYLKEGPEDSLLRMV